MIGFAIIQGYLLDVFFAPHVYKALLNRLECLLCMFIDVTKLIPSSPRPFSLNDIEAIDVSFYNSLVYLQENDPEDLQLTFSVEEETPEKVRKRFILCSVVWCLSYWIFNTRWWKWN